MAISSLPYIARKTVDLPPALVLAMQLLMGALFGILGVLFADPILATMKVVLVDLSKQQAAEEGDGPAVVAAEAVKAAAAAAAGRLLLSAAPASAASARRRRGRSSGREPRT